MPALVAKSREGGAGPREALMGRGEATHTRSCVGRRASRPRARPGGRALDRIRGGGFNFFSYLLFSPNFLLSACSTNSLNKQKNKSMLRHDATTKTSFRILLIHDLKNTHAITLKEMEQSEKRTGEKG
jgi:hypothetical protein